MSIYQKLQKVQFELKAPKNKRNSFGNYNYRSAEDILEAFKPYGEKYQLVLLLNDAVYETTSANYIMSTATLVDVETGETIKNNALAREAVSKKGMDDSQITGTASSYARKYALNGLLLLDDTKDADTDEYQNETNRTESKKEKPKAEPVAERINDEDLKFINAELERTGIPVDKILKSCNIKKLEDMNKTQLKTCANKFKITPNKETK